MSYFPRNSPSATKMIGSTKPFQAINLSVRNMKGSFPILKSSIFFLARCCSTKPNIGSDSVKSKDHHAIERNSNSTLPSSLNRFTSCKGLVLDLGHVSSWDGAEVGSPVVKRYIGDDEERWYMWYHGRPVGEDGLDGSDSIGLATSMNGICWARGVGSVKSSGDVGMVMKCRSDWWAFDRRSVRPSEMVIMSSPMYSAVYWLYYTGCAEEGVEFPGLACSQDGRNWARIEGDHHSGAVLDVGSSPKVVVHGSDDIRMYYHSYDAEIGQFGVELARSRDGVRWVKLGRIMGSGKEGSFDELGVVNANVVKFQRDGKFKYLMAYEGVSRCGVRSIGMAVSEDGLRNWERIGEGPVLQAVGEDGWDSVGVCSPCLVQMEGGGDDQWRMYYKGVGEGGRTGIGMAISGGSDISRFSRWEAFHT